MTQILPDSTLDQLFRTARSYNGFQPTPVSAIQLQAVYELARMGPTSANCSPARFVFITSPEGKEKLLACVAEGNRLRVTQAPVTVLIGHDMAFADQMGTLFPHNPDVKSWFADPAVALDTAFRNATLQGAYLMLAARSLGLDCGPMSGFDKDKADAAFFAGTAIKSNFLCSLGYGVTETLHPRLPRLAFDTACQIV